MPNTATVLTPNRGGGLLRCRARRQARLPYDEPGRDRAHAVGLLAAHGGEQQPRASTPNLLQAHVHAGQRRLGGERHRLPVVEADEGDVVRYPAPGGAERIGDTAGDLVAAAEDRVGVRPVAEQQPGRLPAPALAPLAEPHVAVRHRVRGLERGAEPRRPQPRAEEALRPGDVPDPSPAYG